MRSRIALAAAVLLSMGALLGWLAFGPANLEQQPAANVIPQPVSGAQHGFTPEQVARIHTAWEWQDIFKTGDTSLYLFLHFSEFYPTKLVRRSGPMVVLERDEEAKVGSVRIKSALGEMSLDKYLVNPHSRAQGMIVVHRGKIAFEKYPGMRDQDSHLMMSIGKTMVSLVIALLEAHGKIDVQRTIGAYVPTLRDTAWNAVKVIDVLDMASGLDVGESVESRNDPTSTFGRFVRAAFNVPGPDGKLEKHTDVIRSARRLRDPGPTFEYSSINTQVLVLLAEAVEHRPWADIFQERVWSKMNTEGDLQVATTPDGIAMPCGLCSVRLRDLARFGMLYTPSWNRAARGRVVSVDMVKQIQKGALAGRKATLAERSVPVTFSRQWDVVRADGDFFKKGLHGQGLYVSPGKDLVIAWFSTAASSDLVWYACAIATAYGGASNAKTP